MKVTIKPVFVDADTAAAILSISKSTVEALGRDKDSGFPKVRRISAKRTGYLLREIEDWAETRPVSDLLPPPNTGAKKPRKGIS
jgi:prophage regulatory protein